MLRPLRRVLGSETKITRFDERANGRDKVLRCLRTQPIDLVDCFETIELVQELVFAERDFNAALLSKLFCCSDLMVVAMFAHARSARHDYYPLS